MKIKKTLLTSFILFFPFCLIILLIFSVNIILKDINGTKSIYLGAYGVPETFIIDSELNILRKYIGPLNLENEIEIKKLVQ